MGTNRTDAQTAALRRLEKKHGKPSRVTEVDADRSLRVVVYDALRERDVTKAISSSGLITEVP